MVYICVCQYTALPTLLAAWVPACYPKGFCLPEPHSGCPGGAEEVSGKAKIPGGEFVIQKPQRFLDVGAVGVQVWEQVEISAVLVLDPSWDGTQGTPGQPSPLGVKQCNQPSNISSHIQNKDAKFSLRWSQGTALSPAEAQDPPWNIIP